MSVTDPIADMLTRLRNASMARHQSAVMPTSKLKLEIARILKEEGFIKGFDLLQNGNRKMLRIWLRYSADKRPALTGLKRVSRPGLRVYSHSTTMPRVLSGLGIAIVSTPHGVMTSHEARRRRAGGEVLCYIW
ncbi:MAG: 30S ribosomal protein S8 [Chloroflexi bacterium]|nr:30S ribosomal protein S8 [Chloroflexota bacterium]